MQKYIALTCSALARSVYAAAADSPATVVIELLDQGLHNTPKNLRARLQDQIDAISQGDADAILLAYGICGTSTLGIQARDIPLVLPRAHDCITLYLGSRARYNEEFNAHPGTYWYSLDYMENNKGGAVDGGLGAANLGVVEGMYEEYVEKYGQDNADYLMEVMGAWGQHYDRAVYIDTGLGDGRHFEQMAQEQAQRRGWQFERREGSRRLITALVHGDWNTDEFLVVPPGHITRQTSEENGLVEAAPATASD